MDRRLLPSTQEHDGESHVTAQSAYERIYVHLGGSVNSNPTPTHLAGELSHKVSISSASSSSSNEVGKDGRSPSSPSSSSSLSDDDFDVKKRRTTDDVPLGNSKMEMGSVNESAELPRNATVLGSVANIANNVMGAGLLTLPWAMSQGTTVGSILLYIVVLIASSYTMYIIARACDAAQVFSFRDLFRHSFGDRWGVVVQITVALLVAGACVSYVVLIGDFIPHVFEEFPALHGTVLTNRAFVVSMCAVIFLLPLSLLRDLNSLRHSSVLGLLAISYVAILAVYQAFAKGEIHETVEHYRVTPSIFSTLALANTAFTAHYNAPLFYREMRKRTPDNFFKAIVLAFALCATVYTIVSLAGYFHYGAFVEGDVLNSFDQGKVESSVARIGMAFSVMTTFPLLMYATRSSVDTLIFGDRPYSRLRHYIEVFILLPTIVFIGITFDKVEFVLAYQGSTIGALIVYVYPCVLYLRLVDLPKWHDKIAPIALIVFGITTGAIATYTVSIGDDDVIDLNWVLSLGGGFFAVTVALLALAAYRINGDSRYAHLPDKY